MASLQDHQLSALKSLFPAKSTESLTALLQHWREVNGKTGWDSYVQEMHSFCAFFGQPQNHFTDAQYATWNLHDFFN